MFTKISNTKQKFVFWVQTLWPRVVNVSLLTLPVEPRHSGRDLPKRYNTVGLPLRWLCGSLIAWDVPCRTWLKRYVISLHKALSSNVCRRTLTPRLPVASSSSITLHRWPNSSWISSANEPEPGYQPPGHGGKWVICQREWMRIKRKLPLSLKKDPERSVKEICEIVGISRNTYYK